MTVACHTPGAVLSLDTEYPTLQELFTHWPTVHIDMPSLSAIEILVSPSAEGRRICARLTAS